MRSSRLLTFSFLLLGVPTLAQQKPNPTLIKNYGKLPLSFEKNIGQTDKRVKFFSRGSGYSLFLTPKEAVFSLKRSSQKPNAKQHTHAKPEKTAGAVLRMQLVGANAHAPETTQAKFSGTTNYFVGKDQSKWRTGVENFGRVGFSEVYKGVDVVYYGNQSQLEYDFIVKPTAQPSEIRLKFAGAKRVKTLPSGELLLETGNGSLKWHAPIAYQEANGKRKPVQAKYSILKGREVCFAVGAYDTSKPLVIDPALVYSTYLGGAGSDYKGDYAYAITVDSKGYAYVAGGTGSTDFPTTKGAFQTKSKGGFDGFDAFVTKLSADGKSLVYSTFLGGIGDDEAYAIALDSKGNAYVAGYTKSEDFPTKGAFQKENMGVLGTGFVTKLSADGKSLLYSTYLGGSREENAYAIAVDSAGSAYVAGFTASDNFPITAGAFQTQNKGSVFGNAFVTKFSATGKSLVYSTYLGGTTQTWDGEGARSIALDSKGNVFVAGYTDSSDFPTTTGAFQTTYKGAGFWEHDGFVTKLSADGKSLLYSTYLGGKSDDSPNAIAIDSAGNAYVAGGTGSTDFPTTTGAFQTQKGYGAAFATKLSADGSALVYSTFLKTGYAFGIAVDSKGVAYIAGSFLMKLSSDGSSSIFDTTWTGATRGIALDTKGAVYIAGSAWADLITTMGAFQTKYKGKNETNAFISKFNLPRSVILLSVPSLNGGETTTGTVLLDSTADADTKVSLGSNSTLVTLPSSVTIPKGANSVNINVVTSATSKDTEVHLTTTPVSQLGYTTLWVLAPKTLTQLATPTRMFFDTKANGNVALDGFAPLAGIVVNLSTDNPALVVPSSVTIASFQTNVDFPITFGNITSNTTVTLSASYKGVTLKQKIKVQAVSIVSVALNPTSVTGGNSVTGTVTVAGTVPSGGLVVNLSSTKTDAQLPKSIIIPAGKSSADFTITTNKVTTKVKTYIKATYEGTQVQSTLTINP